MDLQIAGYDVDVKFSISGRWMIPPQAIGKPLILISANEKSALFSFGLAVAHPAYLTAGKNWDRKVTIKAKDRSNIWWLAQGVPYPGNFWRDISADSIRRISDGRTGNERMMTLFREVLDKPIPRKIIEDVAQQLDFTRRIRRDKKRGTRNILEEEEIYVWCGKGNSKLIEAFGLQPTKADQWIAHRLTDSERSLARSKRLKL